MKTESSISLRILIAIKFTNCKFYKNTEHTAFMCLVSMYNDCFLKLAYSFI